MATVVCMIPNCKYKNGGVYCGNEFTCINSFGQCDVWYFKNGQPRPEPWYAEMQPSGGSDHETPQQEKTDDLKKESEQESKTEDSKNKGENGDE